MNGETLKVAMESHFPFFLPAGYSGSGTNSGCDILLLNATSKILNFNYNIIRSVDGTWGSHNGTHWNGMIGMLIQNEAEAALSGMAMTEARSKVVDFSTPYAFDRTIFVTKVPAPKSKTMAIFSPFTIEVWMAISSAIFFIAIILHYLQDSCGKLRKRRDTNYRKTKLSLYDSLLYVFGTVVSQGGYDTDEESSRILLTFWSVFVGIIVTAYQGLLMSFMANPGAGQAVDTVKALAEAIESGTMVAGTIKDASEYNMFKYSDMEYMKKIFDSIQASAKIWPVHHDTEGLKMVFEHPYAYIAGEMTVSADIRNPNNFILAKDNFVSYGYAIAFRKGFPHVELFDRKIHQLRQSGIMTFWLKKIVRMNQVYQDVQQDNRVLSIYDLVGAFFLLGTGLFISFIVFLVECLRSKLNKD